MVVTSKEASDASLNCYILFGRIVKSKGEASDVHPVCNKWRVFLIWPIMLPCVSSCRGITIFPFLQAEREVISDVSQHILFLHFLWGLQWKVDSSCECF